MIHRALRHGPGRPAATRKNTPGRRWLTVPAAARAAAPSSLVRVTSQVADRLRPGFKFNFTVESMSESDLIAVLNSSQFFTDSDSYDH
jgi:hypothetical protein